MSLRKSTTRDTTKKHTTGPDLNRDLAALAKPDLERICLACLLVKPDLMTDAELQLQDDDFYIPTNRLLYQVMSRIFLAAIQTKHPVIFDTVTILDHLKTLGIQDDLLSGQQGPEFLDALKRSIGPIADPDKFTSYLQEVRESATKRKYYLDLMNLQGTLLQDLDAPVDELLSQAENQILTTHLGAEQVEKRMILLGEGLRDYVTEKMSNPRDFVGISTGYGALDRALSGFRPDSVTFLAGRYKSGKSAFLMNMGLGVAKQGIPVLMISTEMHDREIQIRALGNLSEVSLNRIETGKLTGDEFQKVQIGLALLEALPFRHVRMVDFSPERLMSLIRKFVYHEVGFNEKKESNPCLIIFDYLKMPKQGKNDRWVEKEYQALGILTDSLHAIASTLHVPVLTASQINREGDTAASSRIDWYATAKLRFISYEDELSENQKAGMGDPVMWENVYRLIVEYSRFGAENLRGIPFRFYKDTMRIVEDPSITFPVK